MMASPAHAHPALSALPASVMYGDDLAARTSVASEGQLWAAVAGRLLEISGDRHSAALSYAAQLVAWAQQQGETTAWLRAEADSLCAADLWQAGVDVAALLHVRVPAHIGDGGVARAAEMLLQGGAMGMVVLDWLGSAPPAGGAWQSRLLAAARLAGAWVVVLAHSPTTAASLGPLSTWRVEPRHRLVGERCELDLSWLRCRADIGGLPAPRACRLPWQHPLPAPSPTRTVASAGRG